MRATLALLVLFMGLALAYPGEVLHQIPAPGGYPDGLTYADGYLWITSDADMVIYQINPEDGAVVGQIDPPGPDPEYVTGLTWNGTHLLVTVKPWKIYYVDINTGMAVDSIPAPSGSNNEGLAWDGEFLWSTNFGNNVIYKLDPGTGDVLEWFQPFSPGGNTGLTYDGYNLYVSMQNTQLIYVMLPMVPQPVAYYMAPCNIPQDLAWDGEYLWVTEYEETGAQVYKMDPGTQHLSPATWARVKTMFTE